MRDFSLALIGLTSLLMAFGCGGDDDASESEAEAEAESESESESEIECTTYDECNELDDPKNCVLGICQGGICVAATCDDDNVCTTDVCDGVGGCQSEPFGEFTANPEVAIPDDGTMSDTIAVTGPEKLISLIVELDIDHTYVGDLIITVTHDDTQTTATLLSLPDDDLGGNSTNLNGIYSFADGAAAFPTFIGDDAVVPSGLYAPYSPLSVFAGELVDGDWTITISDNVGDDTGTLHSWTLRFAIPCDDGDACTTGDGCNEGVCEPGPNAC